MFAVRSQVAEVKNCSYLTFLIPGCSAFLLKEIADFLSFKAWPDQEQYVCKHSLRVSASSLFALLIRMKSSAKSK